MRLLLKNILFSKTALIIFTLLITVLIFEILPIVNEARKLFPNSYIANYTCHGILENRPWYGQINSWNWFWLISTPIIIFSIEPEYKTSIRITHTIMAIFIACFIVNLSSNLSIDIRNAPFIKSTYNIPNPSQTDIFKAECYDITVEEKRYNSAYLLALIYAVIYHGWWKIIWYQYHKIRVGFIGKEIKVSWLDKGIIIGSIIIPIFFILMTLIYPYIHR